MLYQKTLLVLILLLGLSYVSCVSQVSPCALSVKSQCGLMAIGLKDVCDCLRADAVCADKSLKGVTPNEVKKTLKPLCKDLAKFLEDCNKEMPCGTGKATTRHTAATSKRSTSTTKRPTATTTRRSTTKWSSKPSTYRTRESRSTTGLHKDRMNKDDEFYSKIKDYMKKLDEQ